MTNNYFMFVGLPASGKSTHRKKLIKEFASIGCPVVVASSDDHIEEYAQTNQTTYNQAFNEFAKYATKEMHKDIDLAFKMNIDLIHDQTNITIKKRKACLDAVPEGWMKFAIVFDVPDDKLDIWDIRLKSRPGKVIPDNIIQNMQLSYEPVAENEDFDMIIHVNSFEEIG